MIERSIMEELYLDEEQYIKHRLDDQINWYSKKSAAAQKKYKAIQTIELILAASTPILGTIALISKNGTLLTIIMSVCGALIAILESICTMNKYHENWIQYRYIAELLKHEKYLFITKTPPYDEDAAFSLLVQRVERTISSENVNWVGINEEDGHSKSSHRQSITGS